MRIYRLVGLSGSVYIIIPYLLCIVVYYFKFYVDEIYQNIIATKLHASSMNNIKQFESLTEHK